MRCSRWTLAVSLIFVSAAPLLAQRRGQTPANENAVTLVGRLDLESYKATIKGLTQFGDRREGTQRNRDAVDWIAAQLESYGYTVERLQYDAPQPRRRGNRRGGRGGGRGGGRARRGRGVESDACPLARRRTRRGVARAARASVGEPV